MTKDFNYYIVNSIEDKTIDEISDKVNTLYDEFTTEPTSDDDKTCMYIRLWML